MKKQLRNLFIIVFALGSFFMMNKSVQHLPKVAAQNSDTVNTSNSNVRIDGDYPLGASSDFMLVAGNRIRHLGWEQMNGRFMANSMSFQHDDAALPILNGNNQDGYLDKLWNPTVLVNEYIPSPIINGEDPEGPKDTAFPDSKKMATLLTSNLSKMYSKTKFVTDTSKNTIETVIGKDNNILDDIWENKFDLLESGEHRKLSELTQFKDNNVTKYQYEKNVPGKSLQQDISEVSDFYKNLTPNDNEESTNFWINDNSIVNDLHDGKSNPTYYKDSDPAVTDIVVNITSKDDAKEKMNLSKSDTQPGKRPVVAIAIDWNKVRKVNESVKGINIVLNYSPYFYENNDKNGKLDMSKLPYLVFNYYGFKGRQFTWGVSDAFKVGNHENHSHSDRDNKDLYEVLGAADNKDWSNPNVLNFGSRVLNNFNDTYDLDNLDESYNQAKQDVSGIAAKTSAVNFDNLTYMWFGSMIIPHGSFYAGSSSQGLYIGGIVAANNITVDGAKISPGHGDGVFGNNPGTKEKDFPDLNTGKSPKITQVDLTAPDNKLKSATEDDKKIEFDYSTNQLKPLPDSGIKANVKIEDAPDKFGLYYRILKSDSDDTNSWHRVGDGLYEGKDGNGEVPITDLESILTKDKSFSEGGKKETLIQDSENHMGYGLNRTNLIEFGMAKSAENEEIKAEDFDSLSKFKFTLSIDGSLEAIVPKNLDMGTEILGKKEEFKKEIQINEISSAFKNVANQEIDGKPTVVIYNPMKFNFELGLNYFKDDPDNPFYRTDNFGYSLSGNEYLSMVNNSGTIIPVLSRAANLNNNDLLFKTLDEVLQTKSLYFNMPYNPNYKVGKYESDLTWQLNVQ